MHSKKKNKLYNSKVNHGLFLLSWRKRCRNLDLGALGGRQDGFITRDAVAVHFCVHKLQFYLISISRYTFPYLYSHIHALVLVTSRCKHSEKWWHGILPCPANWIPTHILNAQPRSCHTHSPSHLKHRLACQCVKWAGKEQKQQEEKHLSGIHQTLLKTGRMAGPCLATPHTRQNTRHAGMQTCLKVIVVDTFLWTWQLSHGFSLQQCTGILEWGASLIAVTCHMFQEERTIHHH